MLIFGRQCVGSVTQLRHFEPSLPSATICPAQPLRRGDSNFAIFAEADILDFEILSALLVSREAPFTGGNGQYCRKPCLSGIRNIAR